LSTRDERNQTNGMGNRVGRAVANHATLLLEPDDWPAKRAGFLRRHLGDAMRAIRAVCRR
jgi:hypothetical protein